MFKIIYTNGDFAHGFESYAAAMATVALEYESVVIGHSGDLSEGGDRTFCWSDSEMADNDDGRNAFAYIARDD